MPFEGGTTAGVFVRFETPKPIVDRLNKAVVAASRTRPRTSACANWAPSCAPPRPPSSPRSLKADEANVAELLKEGLLKPD